MNPKFKRGGGRGGGGGHDSAGGMRWLLTYADMITLLLALFIFLFSISTVSAAKLQAFTSVFADLFGVSKTPFVLDNPTGSNGALPMPGAKPAPKNEPESEEDAQQRRALLELRRRLEASFPDLISTGKLVILEKQGGLILRISEAALFDLGSAAITPQAVPVLETIAGFLSEVTNDVRVEGHTDDLPIKGGRYSTNWELSGARAVSVVLYFIQEGGIAPQRLSLAGYGEYRPIEPNMPARGNPVNRRVEIMVIERRAVPAEGI
jgi:chemotaxis protein MotB